MTIFLGGEMMMPQYFFDVRSIEWSYHDPDGITLADDDTAISYAERMIRELKADEGYDAPDLQMLVKNAAQPSNCYSVQSNQSQFSKKHYSVAPIGIT